jgi:hypothetical protein
VSDASLHDSQKLEDVLDASSTASDVWADRAYRSKEIEPKQPEQAGAQSRPKDLKIRPRFAPSVLLLRPERTTIRFVLVLEGTKFRLRVFVFEAS